ARQRASVKWLLSKAFNNRVPDNLKEPFYRDHENQERLKPQIIVELGNATLYCQTLSNLYSDPNYQSMNHWSIIQTLARKGVPNAHMSVIESLMVLYAKEISSGDRVMAAIRRISGNNYQAPAGQSYEQALLGWISHACAALKKRIIKEVDAGLPDDNTPDIPPVRDFQDLCDGICLALLISYYCPKVVPWTSVRINYLPAVEDSIHNILLVCNFSQKHLPYSVFHMTPEDVTYMRGSMKLNLVVLLTDLFNLFEIHPAKCVCYPGMDGQGRRSRRNSSSEDSQLTIENFGGSQDQLNTLGRYERDRERKLSNTSVGGFPVEPAVAVRSSIADARGTLHRSTSGYDPESTPVRKSSTSSMPASPAAWQLDVVGDDDMRSLENASKLSTIRMKLEEKRRRIEQDKRKIEMALLRHQEKEDLESCPDVMKWETMSNESKRTPDMDPVDLDKYQQSIAIMNMNLQDIQQDIHRLATQQSQMQAQHLQAQQLMQAQQIANMLNQPTNHFYLHESSPQPQPHPHPQRRTWAHSAAAAAYEQQQQIQPPLVDVNAWQTQQQQQQQQQHQQKQKQTWMNRPPSSGSGAGGGGELQHLFQVQASPQHAQRGSNGVQRQQSLTNLRDNRSPKAPQPMGMPMGMAMQHEDMMAPQSICFIGDEEDDPRAMASGGEDQPPEKGFYISFDDEQPKRPKPPLRAKRSPKKEAPPGSRDSVDHQATLKRESLSQLHNNNNSIGFGGEDYTDEPPIQLRQLAVSGAVSPIGHERRHLEDVTNQPPQQMQQQPMSPTRLQQNSNIAEAAKNKALVIGADTANLDPDSVDEMERRKEKIMLLSLQRRQQQEEAKARKEIESSQKREKEREKEEERSRKKEEQMARRAAILEQHRLKKAIEEAEREGKTLDRPDLHVKLQPHSSTSTTPRLRQQRTTRPRPKTIHVDDASVDISEASSISSRGKKGSSSNLTDSGLGRATPPRRAPSPGMGMGASGRHMPSPSGPGSLPPGLISKRRGFDDGSSDFSLTPNLNMEYSGPKLYKQPAAKSNRGIILNAVEYCVFPGVVNREAKQKVLEKIARSEAKHFLVLFRDAGCQYNSGGKCFSQVHTKHLTVTIDAFTIHNSLWQGKRVQLPSKKDMALVI
ncbi:hypothetical protein M5D96_007108, partial [Drosophila gunungcola]